MRRIANTRIAALVAALIAGALVAYALRSGSVATTGSPGHVQQQAVEVRTQIIRRTVRIVRHERPPRGHRRSGTVGGSTAAVTGTHVVARTASSGAHAAVGGVAPAAALRTRSSGASGGSSGGSAATPVRTRTSAGSGARGGSGGSVRTRTSGAGADGGDRGERHDD